MLRNLGNKKTDLDNKELLVELCKVLLNTQ